MKISTMAWLLTGGFILGGMGVAACSSSSGGNPSTPPPDGGAGGGGGSVAGGGGGAAGGGSTDGGSTCSTPPKLYPKAAGGQYCPFSGTPTVDCTSPGQGCCETPENDAGAISTCVATTGGGGGAGGGGGTAGGGGGTDAGDDGGGEGGAAGGGGTGGGGGGSSGPVTLNCPYPGSTPWICQGTADCASGSICCSVPQGTPEYDNTCLYYFWSHFAGTQCETNTACNTGETQICYTQAECPSGKTCTASKAKGNDFGFCM